MNIVNSILEASDSTLKMNELYFTIASFTHPKFVINSFDTIFNDKLYNKMTQNSKNQKLL